MKKIIVITASLLFAALVVLGGDYHYSDQQVNIEKGQKLDFHARVVEQQLVLEFDIAPKNGLRVELYNLTGKRIGLWKVNETKKKITLDNLMVLQQGLYIIKVTDGQSASAQKFKI